MSSNPNATHYTVLTAVGPNRPGLVDICSRTIRDCGCNIVDSRMTVLGGEFAMIMLLSGPWDAIARLEDAARRLHESLDLTVVTRRTEQGKNVSGCMLPYSVEVVGLDHPGIVHEIAHFFSSREISIEDLYTSSYAAAHTGAPMFSLHMHISLPQDVSIAALRGEFLDFCDHLNLDAVMEPIK